MTINIGFSEKFLIQTEKSHLFVRPFPNIAHCTFSYLHLNFPLYLPYSDQAFNLDIQLLDLHRFCKDKISTKWSNRGSFKFVIGNINFEEDLFIDSFRYMS